VPTSTLPALGATARTQGAGSNDKNVVPGEPADHAIGRSRGGLTTKIHALTDQSCRPVTVLLSPGQAGDNPHLLPLLAAYTSARPAPRGNRHRFRLLADKAYSHPSTRAELRKRKIAHTIPERSDQKQRRKDKGSAGGRPPAFDVQIYKKRNTVERGFHRLKQWRAIATRYDKLAVTFLGGVILAATIIHANGLGDTP
jgi:putative transposase